MIDNTTKADAEAIAIDLEEPLNLLKLLDDEIQDLYSQINGIKAADSKQAKINNRLALAFDIESRIGIFETLSNIAGRTLKDRQNELFELSEPDHYSIKGDK